MITVINISGGRDIAAGLPGEFINVDPEWVIEQNPSIVLLEPITRGDSGYDVNNLTAVETKLKGFTNITGFSNIDAVKNQRVYAISISIFSNNPWIGTVYLAKLLHPGLFQDLNPRAVHQEYLKKFLHLDFDISNQGLFLYPIPEGW